MTGIFYFSSTGNSLQISKAVQARLGGRILYIPEHIGDTAEYDRIILVTPVYSFGLPVPVCDFLPTIGKDKEIIAILDYGGMAGHADRLLCEYADFLELNIVSVYTLKMPENFTLYLRPPRFYTESVLKSSDKRIGKILDRIERGEFALPKLGKTHEKTYLKNKGNWHKIGERFSVTDYCFKCGKCVKLCPSQNISFADGKITFGNKCIACLGCYHRCPQKAIVYMNKKSKYRYVNPLVSEWEIGKDL